MTLILILILINVYEVYGCELKGILKVNKI